MPAFGDGVDGDVPLALLAAPLPAFLLLFARQINNSITAAARKDAKLKAQIQRAIMDLRR